MRCKRAKNVLESSTLWTRRKNKKGTTTQLASEKMTEHNAID